MQKIIQSKYFLFGGIGLVILIILFDIVSGFFSSSRMPPVPATPSTVLPTPVIIQSGQSSQQSPILPAIVPDGWNVFEDSRVALAYPPGWSATSQSAAGRDLYVAFTSDNATNGAFPVFDFQTLPNTSLEQEITTLSPLQLQEQEITFQGNPGVMLHGTLPLTFETGNAQQTPVFETYILFLIQGKLYMIDEAAYEDSNQQATQQVFNQILSTIKLP